MFEKYRDQEVGWGIFLAIFGTDGPDGKFVGWGFVVLGMEMPVWMEGGDCELGPGWDGICHGV